MEVYNNLTSPEFIWCIIGILMLLAEFMMPGFVIFFFGLGALIVSGLCLIFNISINAQLIIFLVSSIILLIALRRIFTKIFRGFFNSKAEMPLNINSNVGETAIVIEKITPLKKGKVEFHGSNWEAVSDEEIQEDTPVIITEQNNITLKVKPRQK